ncbi:MAG TPA: conjugative transposon protein TraK [Puia sp.]|nr:conjugative transposon protein TraK [Puia sp.]
MFPKTKNIETAFQHIRLFSLVFLIACAGLTGLIVWRVLRLAEQGQGRVYVLTSGRILEALASDRKENIPVEARDHIRSFHQYFFTLAPDEKVINANISHAFYLADGSAKRLYDNLKENGYYAGIISGNISQEIGIDSIALDTKVYPFYFRCWATQRIIRTTSLITRGLLTEGWLRTTVRSENNPHGFLIERWNTIENKDLKIEKR